MRCTSIKILLGVTSLFAYPIMMTSGIVGNFGDIYQYAAPFRHFAKTTLHTGVIPLWNPYIFSGTPFLASPQSALFYPLTAIFYFLPIHIAFNWFTTLHLFLNALGMFLLLREFGRSQSASIWGAIVWSYSYFFLSKLAAGHVIHISGYSLAPFIILFLTRSLRTAQEYGMPFFCIALGMSIQFFSGHLQVWLHTLIFSFVILAAQFFTDTKHKKWIVLYSIFFFVLFICFTAIQIFPTLKYFSLSSRWTSSYEFATSYSLEWINLIGFLIPNFFGNPVHKNYIDPLHPSIFFETQSIYFGLIPFFLAFCGWIFACKKKKFLLFFMPVLFLFLSAGKNGFLYHWVWKILSCMRVPARFYFLCFMVLLFCAAFSWDVLLKNKRTLVKIFVFFLTIVDLWFYGHSFVWSENHRNKLDKSEAIRWMTASGTNISNNGNIRIFTTQSVPNPNKSMFFRIQNGNGYEAILSQSLFDYYSLIQGARALTTTGVDLIYPNRNKMDTASFDYIISMVPLNTSWPVQYFKNHLWIYRNPNPMPVAYSLPNFSSSHLINYKRVNPNKIEMYWNETKSSSPFWIYFSEAYAPGWQLWNNQRTGSKVLQARRYFRTALLNQGKNLKEKVFWLYSPSEFKGGLILTCFVLCALILLSFHKLKGILHDTI